MRRPDLSQPSLALRASAGATGVILIAAAARAAELACARMAAMGSLCGASVAHHCGWCFGATGLALAGLAALAAAAPRDLSRCGIAAG
ncbi:MAG TPA: hypothetical protein VFW13_16235 [Phenylobacterium sp.]|nr:hypothetical protein [Phenylobacterium sp.]